MSDSTQHLNTVATTSSQKEVLFNELVDALSPSATYGRNARTTSGLTWGYYGGRYLGNSVANGTKTLTNATTNYISVNRATGAVDQSTATTNWNDNTHYGRAYKIVTAGSAVSSYEDHRFGPYGIHAKPEPGIYTTAVGNVGTGEDNLITHTIAASTLYAAKRTVRITAWGTAANNANAKTLKLYFGSVAILTLSLTVSQTCKWRIIAEVISTGTNAQDYGSQIIQSGTASQVSVENGTLTQTDSSAITVKCTGDATSDNDVVQEGMIVEYFG